MKSIKLLSHRHQDPPRTRSKGQRSNLGRSTSNTVHIYLVNFIIGMVNLKLLKRRLTTGEKGWLGLVVYIFAVDSIAWKNQVRYRKKDETMSVSWGRWLQCPRNRALTGIAWVTISLHLFLSMPLPGEKTLKNFVQSAVKKRRTRV